MREVFKKYLNDEIKYSKKQLIGIISLVIVIAGIFGWVYEFIFYYFDQGMDKFYYQGGNFLPWINIYAYGALFIILFSYKYKKSPLKVFLISLLSTGLLEFLSGFILHKYFGLRFWDYNIEILNFGNIGGYICLRSVTFFAVSGLLLMYLILPFCVYLSEKIKTNKFLIISLILLFMIVIDDLYNLVISKVFDLPNAIEIYKNLGFNFMIIKELL